MSESVIKFDRRIDAGLKGLLLKLYPDVETDKELADRVDAGTEEYDFKTDLQRHEGDLDGIVTNAEIYNFLVKEGHASELIAAGWIVPHYIAVMPEEFKERFAKLDSLPDKFSKQDIIQQRLKEFHSRKDCPIEGTAQDFIENNCGFCSEFAYAYYGILKYYGLDEGVSFAFATTRTDSLREDFNHALVVVNNENESYFADVNYFGFQKKDDYYLYNSPMTLRIFADDSSIMCAYLNNKADDQVNDLDDAIAVLEQAVALCPWYAPNYGRFEKIYLARGDAPSALRNSNVSVALDPQPMNLYNHEITKAVYPWLHLEAGVASMAGLKLSGGIYYDKLLGLFKLNAYESLPVEVIGGVETMTDGSSWLVLGKIGVEDYSFLKLLETVMRSQLFVSGGYDLKNDSPLAGFGLKGELNLFDGIGLFGEAGYFYAFEPLNGQNNIVELGAGLSFHLPVAE